MKGLESGELRPVYCLAGAAGSMGERAVARIRARLAAEGEEPALRVFDGKEASAAEVAAAAAAVPLTGGAQVVWARNVDAMSAEDKRALAALVEAPPAGSVVVLTAEKFDGPLAKAARQAGALHAAAAPAHESWIAWIRREAKERGLTIERPQEILEAVGERADALTSELDKLACLADERGAVSSELLAEALMPVGARRAPYGVFKLADAVAERRGGEALAALRRLLAAGEPEPYILHMLARHFRHLLFALREDRPAQIQRELGLRSSFQVERLRRQARMWAPHEVEDALLLMARVDQEMKRSASGPAVHLERLVARLCAG